MDNFLSYTLAALAAVSDPNEIPFTRSLGPPPPLPKELLVSLRLAETLQHLVETALAGECGPFKGFQRIHLN